MANELVLPAVRSALVNEWEVREPDAALTLVEAMVSADVGDGVVRALIEQVGFFFWCIKWNAESRKQVV